MFEKIADIFLPTKLYLFYTGECRLFEGRAFVLCNYLVTRGLDVKKRTVTTHFYSLL